MLKKIYITFVVGFILTILVACSNNTDGSLVSTNEVDHINEKIQNLYSVDYTNDAISLIYNDEQEFIEYKNLYDSSITINRLKFVENQLMIFGEKDNKPYFSIPTITEIGKLDFTGSNEFIYHRDGGIKEIRYDEFTNTYEADYTLTDGFSSTFNIEANRNHLTTVKQEIQYNYTKGTLIKPTAIVIHETANYNRGADAYSHYKFWNSDYRGSSVHFGVDENIVFQYLDTNKFAWHVGSYNKTLGISNANAIGIEIMVNKDGNYYEAIENTISLTAKLMVEFNIDIENVVTHQMASAWGKPDPLSMLVYSVNDVELQAIRELLGGNDAADKLISDAFNNNPRGYTIEDFYNDLEGEYNRLRASIDTKTERNINFSK